MVMRVFVAGGTGVLGRRLVPQVAARGHQVTATTTSPAKLDLLAQLGAAGVVMDGLDAASVGEAVAAAQHLGGGGDSGHGAGWSAAVFRPQYVSSFAWWALPKLLLASLTVQ